MILKRAFELEILEKDFTSPTSSFTFVFGRKQMGKTTFLQEYIKNKETLFFSCIEVLPHFLFESFQQQIAKKHSIANTLINSFEGFLQLLNSIDFTKKTVLVFDDIHILSKIQKDIFSVFHTHWNNSLKYKNIQIVFSSSIHSSSKEENFLYTYASKSIFLHAFEYNTIKMLLPNINNEEQLKLFALFGTNIKYLKQYNSEKSFEENIKEILINNQQTIQNDGILLIKSELSDTATYASILFAIANGKNKIGEIAQVLGVKSSYLTRYLQKLQDMMFITKRVPMNEDFAYSKFGRYVITDNYIKFWFKIIYFNAHLYEPNSMKKFLDYLFQSLQEELLPEAFKMHMEELVTKNFETIFGYKPICIGGWWSNKEKQIDMIAYDDCCITFIEFQLQMQENIKRIYDELKIKSEAFETVLEKKYALFSSH